MSLTVSQNYTAIAPGITVSFLGLGGTSPYTYAVSPIPVGPGGTINSSTGVYTAPVAPSNPPISAYDTIVVTDNVGATVTSQIFVGTPLQLVCDVISTGMGLAPGRTFLWDQKIFQPTDDDLYIVVGIQRCRIFGNTKQYNGGDSGLSCTQYANMQATLDINAISRGPAARDRKEQILMALYSDYAEQQMEANSFFIGSLPAGSQFINISHPDGAAIPYRFVISVNIQYTVATTAPVSYFSTFQTPQVATNP